MNSNSILLLQKFLSIRGQICRATWRRPMKTRKGVCASIEKQTIATVRAGVSYDRMKAVIEKRESGELPKENAGLPWGKWAQFGGESLFPHVIEHTCKGETEPCFYFRFATFPGGSLRVTYLINGEEETDWRVVRALCLKSEFDEPPADVFTVKADSVLSLS